MRPAVRSGRCSPRTGWRRGRRTLVGASSSSPPPADHVFDTLGATWWIDAAEEPQDRSGVQWALNRGNQAVPHARLGSTGRAELRGSYGLLLPGVTSNMAYVPAVALTDATVAIQFKQPLSTMLTGLGANTVAGRGTVSGGAFSDWGVVLGGSALGGNSWMMSGLGASGWSGSAIPLAIRDAADVWYRWSRDDATGNVTCHYSTDGTSWTAAGSLTSAAGALASANGYFLVGGSVYNSMTTPMTVRRMVITSSGTTVFDADFTAPAAFATSFTESSSNAATVTINATSGSDTNDPLLLPHTGTNYLYLPGLSGNFPSWTMTQPTSIEYVARFATADWTPSSAGVIALCGAGSYLGVKSDGTLEFQRKTGGSTTWWASTTSTGFTDGATYWVRCTYDSVTGDVKFYTAADQATEPVSWTQLGTTRAAGAGALDTASTSCDIGRLAGSYYRVIIRDAASGGNTIFDANLASVTNQSSFTESSANAATVTINRATSGRKSVMVIRPVWLFGTDDYMEVADNDLLDFGTTDSMTILAVCRHWGTLANATFVSKMAAGKFTFNLCQLSGTTGMELYDGTNNPIRTNGTLTSGTLVLASGIRSVAADKVYAQVGSTVDGTGVTDTTTTTVASTGTLAVGRRSTGTNYDDVEIVAVAVFRSALSSSDLADIASYFGV
jgi:hypothetical protein